MSGYEYAVVPAPKKGLKARGVKSTEDRFAFAIQSIMNEYGAEGWEYLRTDTLPCEERQGLTGRTTTFQNMLVFRKPLAAEENVAPEIVAPIPALAPPVEMPEEATAVVEAEPETVVESVEDRTAEALGTDDDAMRLESRPLDVDPERPEPRVAAE